MLSLLLFALQDAPPFVEHPLTAAEGDGQVPVRTLCGSPDKNYILEVNGGGLVLGDFDLDGSHDLVLVDGSTIERARAGEPGNPPRLLLNDGAGGFRTAPEPWAMAGGRWGMGGAAGDVDGDGDLDLMVTQWGPDRLFLNDAGRGFSEATEQAGFKGTKTWGTSAAFFDRERDGYLDLTVINYLRQNLEDIDEGKVASRESGQCRWKGFDVMCGPEGMNPIHDRLYAGNGDGTYRDVTYEAGYRPKDAGFGLGVTTLDYDNDGDTDLYVTNDSTPNFLWENQGDGTFLEVGGRRGVDLDMNGKEQAGMGIAVADLNEDGYTDLFVTNFSGESNTLYLSRFRRDRISYSDNASRTRLGGDSISFLGWGTGFADFDHDTDLDLFVLNGHVYPQADGVGTDTPYAQTDLLFANQGAARPGGAPTFRLVDPLDTGAARVSRAGASADLDGDGDLDLVAIEIDGTVRVLRNEFADGHWLRVRPRMGSGNTHALRATVELKLGERVLRREVRTAGGFQAALPAEVHFGLGAAETYEALTITWPDGTVQELGFAGLDQVLEVQRPDGGEADEEGE
ncbi:MAG: CRTAC1 family protein [Planctomycetota bacterium]